MKKGIIIFFSVIIMGTLLYYLLGMFSSFIGWYGYGKWKYRVRTSSIESAKQRKVFVRELNYKIVDSANLCGFIFKPYIEKGFRYGYHSMEETRIDNYTKFPYSLNYERNQEDSITLDIFPEDMKKLDSSGVVWGYLKKPYLKDTIRINIDGNHKKGIIKVW